MICNTSQYLLLPSHLLWFGSSLAYGVDAHDSDAVAGDDVISEVAIHVQLDVAREFPFWNRIWTLLYLQYLVNELQIVGQCVLRMISEAITYWEWLGRRVGKKVVSSPENQHICICLERQRKDPWHTLVAPSGLRGTCEGGKPPPDLV